jgi:hypothetical protein
MEPLELLTLIDQVIGPEKRPLKLDERNPETIVAFQILSRGSYGTNEEFAVSESATKKIAEELNNISGFKDVNFIPASRPGMPLDQEEFGDTVYYIRVIG